MTQPERGGRLQCLECRRWYRNLAPHLRQTHQMGVAAYREAHELPATYPLRAADLRQAQAERARAWYATDERFRYALMHSLEERRAAAAIGVERHRETSGRSGIRIPQARRAAVAAAAISEAAAARHERTAREQGWQSLAALLADQTLSNAAVGRVLGLTRGTARHWRRKSLGDH